MPMTQSSIVVYEDPQSEMLAPVTYARMACAIHCASYRLVDLLRMLIQQAAESQPTELSMYGLVRPHLESMQKIDFPDLLTLDSGLPKSSKASPSLMLSARIAPTRTNFNTLTKLLEARQGAAGKPAVLFDRDTIAAIVDPPWSLEQIARTGYEGMSHLLEEATGFARLDDGFPLTTFAVPHEIIACNMSAIGENLAWRIEQGESEQSLIQTNDGVFVAPNASVGDYVLTDTRKGPIVIDAEAQIGPYTLLRGPIYVGPRTKILEHSAIKDAVTLCHTTKIGGEVEASIVEPYTNKQHHGFLGHSYLGSWINLGAGTCNSDLKNTYGNVNMEYPFGKATTNMQFLGCVMGDYSKTAINTGIFTGKVIGACSMMYGFVTSNVPSFVNYARLFGQVASLPPEVMVSTQQRMFARRNVEQRRCDIQLLYDMHRLTQHERDGLGEGLTR